MNTRQRWLIAGLAVLVVALGAVVITQTTGDDEGEDIFLEGKREVGLDPFTTIALSRCPDGYEDAPAGSQDECVPVASTTTTALGATTTALFGGSGDQRVCDPEALIRFLRDNPDKAQAWVDALNSDPTLEWSGGHQLTLADIPTYIRELTPTFLAEDTRVTNHGFKNGKATPRQSVLQKGTAVLVDRNGVPRTRCACGNPLIPPKQVDDPHYRGECWPGCHDRPYCAPPGCFATTTSSSSSSTTSTTTCFSTGLVAGQSGCEPPPVTSTTKRKPTVTQPTSPPTTAASTTAPPPPPTTTTRAITTTTTSPNSVTTTTGKT